MRAMMKCKVKAETARNITDALKVFQLLLAFTILGITAHIVNRYQKLVDNCPPDPQGQNCQNEGFVLGAMKYCLVPPILAICDAVVWLVDSYLAGLPYTFVIWCAWIVQGFYMGGGCTLTSRIDGAWKCQNNRDGRDGSRLCNELFADIALMWVAVVTTWAIIVFLYQLSNYYPRGMTTDMTEHRSERRTGAK